MNESYVTLQGWVGGEVDLRPVADTQCASFRVGSTPRYHRNGTWVDGTTSWFTVNCWRGLARNVRDSIKRGDPVVVHGRVRVDTWEREDKSTGVKWVIDATFVGHDLNRGTSGFVKTARSVPDPHEPGTYQPASYQPESSAPGTAGDRVEPGVDSPAA
jgi:single-strand DNA-binding protein